MSNKGLLDKRALVVRALRLEVRSARSRPPLTAVGGERLLDLLGERASRLVRLPRLSLTLARAVFDNLLGPERERGLPQFNTQVT